jgi:hypothetical protein
VLSTLEKVNEVIFPVASAAIVGVPSPAVQVRTWKIAAVPRDSTNPILVLSRERIGEVRV